MPDTIVGPWHIPQGDPVLDNARAALPLLRPRVIDAFTPGAILLQSTNRPPRTPSWAWGLTPWSRENWVSEKHPYVIEEYSCNHELGHCFDDLFLTPADRVVLMAHMGITVPVGSTDKQIAALWKKGKYDGSVCFVPREGFADAFAKSQAQAPAAPLDPKANGFLNVLPHFFTRFINLADPAEATWFLRFIKAIA